MENRILLRLSRMKDKNQADTDPCGIAILRWIRHLGERLTSSQEGEWRHRVSGGRIELSSYEKMEWGRMKL